MVKRTLHINPTLEEYGISDGTLRTGQSESRQQDRQGKSPWKMILAVLIFGAAFLLGKYVVSRSITPTPDDTGVSYVSETEPGETAGTGSSGTTDTGGSGTKDTGRGVTAGAGEINVCLSSEPQTLDPALFSTDELSILSHLFSGLTKWQQTEDGAVEIVPDAAEELSEGVLNDDGTITYTYRLREDLKWSDGQTLTAGDFVYAWNRAVSPEIGADYEYLFDNVDGYSEIMNGQPDAKLNVKAVDDFTLEVTLANNVPYWNELLAFPIFFPVREAVAENESWAGDSSTYVSNGAYTMAGWSHDNVITLTKNENYACADDITMPVINFWLSDDVNYMMSEYESGDWQFIDEVSGDAEYLTEMYPDELVIAGSMGTYYFEWNVNKELLPAGAGLTGDAAERARAEIRNAVSLMIDRSYICEEIGQLGQLPASSFVSMGLTDADGKSQFYENAGHNDGYIGYYNVSEGVINENIQKALEILKKYYSYDEGAGKFTDFPVLTYLYNTSEGHKAIAKYLEETLSSFGISIELEDLDWNDFLQKRSRGDYDIARSGWLCDVNDPISMLDIWQSGSGNNDAQLGADTHANAAVYSLDLTDLGYDVKIENGTWAETYDVLISMINTCTDKNTRYEMMHRAEDLLMSTGAICPLYYYTDPYLINSSVKGFYASPPGGKYFMYTTIE